MTEGTVLLEPPGKAAMEQFGQWVEGPAEAGQRTFYSEALSTHPPDSVAVLHVNHVARSPQPHRVSRVECHPYASQCFFPLDVSRYAVVVMPSGANGQPLPEQARGFIVPGTIGVIFHPRVWHLGATVFDRPGCFSVLMWRGGKLADDQFIDISPQTLVVAEPGAGDG
ncbi:MAG: ureidoglycolate lyase [Pseudomonadota bacterium]